MCPPRSTKSAFPPRRTFASIARNTPLRLGDDTTAKSADAGFAALHEANVSRAVAAGLTFRPHGETSRDTLAWRGNDAELNAGMNAEREAELVAAWRERPSS